MPSKGSHSSWLTSLEFPEVFPSTQAKMHLIKRDLTNMDWLRTAEQSAGELLLFNPLHKHGKPWN